MAPACREPRNRIEPWICTVADEEHFTARDALAACRVLHEEGWTLPLGIRERGSEAVTWAYGTQLVLCGVEACEKESGPGASPAR